MISPLIIEHEAKRIALSLKLCNHLHYNIKVEYNPATDETVMIAKNEEGKTATVVFTRNDLEKCLDDLDPKIEEALKQLYSRDLSFIMNDKT